MKKYHQDYSLEAVLEHAKKDAKNVEMEGRTSERRPAQEITHSYLVWNKLDDTHCFRVVMSVYYMEYNVSNNRNVSVFYGEMCLTLNS